VPRLRDLPRRDRALCWCYALFTVLDLLAVSALALVYAARHRTEPPLALIGHFVRDALANPAAAFIYADVTLTWLALAVFMVVEARRLRIRWVWAYIAAAPLSALSASVPAFLFVRQLKIAAAAPPAGAAARATTRSTSR
jgi:hypothetical protein